MTGQERDVEALAEVLWRLELRHAESLADEPAEVQEGFREDARAVLASDWPARIKAEAWDEGYVRGVGDEVRGEWSDNPYRADRIGGDR